MTAGEFIRQAKYGDMFALAYDEDGLAHAFTVKKAFEEGVMDDVTVIVAHCLRGSFNHQYKDMQIAERVDCLACIAEELDQWFSRRRSK